MEDKRRQTIRRESFKPPEALWLAMILLCLWMGLGAGISASAAENDSGQEPDADSAPDSAAEDAVPVLSADCGLSVFLLHPQSRAVIARIQAVSFSLFIESHPFV